MTNGKVIRVGIIGGGFGLKAHLPAFYAHTEFKPVAVLTRHKAKAEKAATEFGLEWHGTNLSSFFTEVDMDLVSIASMPSEHYKHAKWALEAGRHILLEKPVADNHKQVRELDGIARKNALLAAVNFEFRFVPARLMALKLIKQGAIGKQRSVDLKDVHNFWADPNTGRLHGWQNKVEFGGGILGMFACHHIDWFSRFGWRWGEFFGKTNVYVKERVDENGQMQPCTAEDYASIIGWRDDGATVTVLVSACFHAKEFSIRMYGTDATLEIIGGGDGYGGENLYYIKPDGSRSEVAIDPEFQIEQALPDYRANLMKPLLDRIVRALREGEEPKDLPTLKDGYNVQFVIDAIRQTNTPPKI